MFKRCGAQALSLALEAAEVAAGPAAWWHVAAWLQIRLSQPADALQTLARSALPVYAMVALVVMYGKTDLMKQGLMQPCTHDLRSFWLNCLFLKSQLPANVEALPLILRRT